MYLHCTPEMRMSDDFLMIYFSHTQVASAPTQVLSPKRLRPASNPLTLTTPANPTVVSTLPSVISSHILNNNYLLASQSQAAAAAVANFQHHHHHHHHPLNPFHHPQPSILQTLPHPLAAKSPALNQQIQSIIASSPTATIPTQIPSFIATAAQQQQQQQLKSINTSSSFNSSPPAVSTVISISQPSTVENNLTTSSSPTTASNINSSSNMDQVGQMGQNPMQSHPLSQSMDSVNTASNEEEVSQAKKVLTKWPSFRIFHNT